MTGSKTSRRTPLHSEEEAILDDELQEYMTAEGPYYAIRHPLVMMYPYDPTQAALANEWLRSKKEGVDNALQSKNWGLFLMLHEKPYRLRALMDIESRMTDEEYWGRTETGVDDGREHTRVS